MLSIIIIILFVMRVGKAGDARIGVNERKILKWTLKKEL
jgi:hypothetical protein